MTHLWIATASAEHVRRGKTGGFAQVCHGKGGPLARTRPGDGIIYYSPTVSFRGKDKLQAFTAIGRIIDRPLYQHDMGDGFVPHRRDVDWWSSEDAPIRPLLEALEFTCGQKCWGYAFRYGLFRVSEGDFGLIARAMQVRPQALSAA